MKRIFWKGSHTYHRLLYHIVFVPKYRRRVLRGKIVKRLSELFYECAEVNRWFIHELAIEPDHVHLLLQIPPSENLSKTVMYLKGGSSRVLRKEHPELEEFLWGDQFWQDGYFAETGGRIDETMLRSYIKNQRDQREREINKTSPAL
jgi:putative transposase